MVSPSLIVKSVVSEPSFNQCWPSSTVFSDIGLALLSVVSAVSLIVLLSSKAIPSRDSVPLVSKTPPDAAVPPEKSRILLFSVIVEVSFNFKVPATLKPAFSTKEPLLISSLASEAIVLTFPKEILPSSTSISPADNVKPPDKVRSALPTLIFSFSLLRLKILLIVKSVDADPKVKSFPFKASD